MVFMMDRIDSDNEEINIASAVTLLLKNKGKIFFVSLFVSIAFYGYSKTLQDLYTSSTLLKINDSFQSENNPMSSLTSQYGGLASLAGISLPSGGGDKAEYIIETAKSKEFAEHLMSFEMVTENIMAAESYSKSKKKIIYDSKLYDFDNDQWVRSLRKYKQKEPSVIEVHKELSKKLSVSKDLDSGFITISFSHTSPVFARDLVNLIVDEVNMVSKMKDLEESEKALVFLNEQLVTYNQVELIRSINTMIKSQLHTKMMANISDDYLVKKIDKPYVPEVKSFPSRALFAILGLLVGFVVITSYILIRSSGFIASLNYSK